jgi:polysaccharide export outer membrane protein
MSLRLAPLLAAAIALAGCAHDDGGDGGLFDRGSGHAAEVEVADAAGARQVDVTVAHGPATAIGAPVVGWGRQTILPAGPRAVAEIDGPYLLDTGDRLRIFVYGQPNLSRLYIVDHDGRITVPLIGAIKARGMTTGGLEGVIRSQLATKFVKDPQVTVDIQQNRPFFILGEVRNAGQYPYVSGMTIETAAAIAGGYSERANERKARITRRVNGAVEVLEVPRDYVVQPGDTVYVYERIF